MTFRQLDRKYLSLQEAIRELPEGVGCAADPYLFFPDDLIGSNYNKRDVAEQAKAICAPCPVRVRCRDYATDAGMVGIWGGTTADERKPTKD